MTSIAVLLSGCATSWTSRSRTHATVYGSSDGSPFDFRYNTFVGAIDGVRTERGRAYVLVDPGRHTLRIVNVPCIAQIAIVFCMKSATHQDVEADLEAGAAYRVDHRNPGPVRLPE